MKRAEKTAAMRLLEKKLLKNKSLPLREANLVMGEGNLDCQVMFIGEAPGAEEDKLGRPFVGRSGKLLDQMIEKLGWQRSDVYISNIVKRRPPDNRDPLPSEIEAYKPYLARQIAIINPPIIATLGRFSMNYFLPKAKITRDQGQAFPLPDGRLLFPLFHPAAVLRGTVPMPVYEASFQELAKVAKKSPPPERPSGRAGVHKSASEFGPFLIQ